MDLTPEERRKIYEEEKAVIKRRPMTSTPIRAEPVRSNAAVARNVTRTLLAIGGCLGVLMLFAIIGSRGPHTSSPTAAPVVTAPPRIAPVTPKVPAPIDTLGREGCDRFARAFDDVKKGIVTNGEFREQIKAARNYTRFSKNSDVVNGGDEILAGVTQNAIYKTDEGFISLAAGCKVIRQ